MGRTAGKLRYGTETALKHRGAAGFHLTDCRTALNLGKPEVHLARLIEQEKGLSAHEMVMVGDRLDTDISFARRSGMRSVLMLTGVAGESYRKESSGSLSELEFPPGSAPTFVVRDFPELMVRFSEILLPPSPQ